MVPNQNQNKPGSDSVPGRFPANGRATPGPAAPAGPPPPPGGRALPAAVMIQLLAALVLLTVSLVQTFVILPALTGGWKELASERAAHRKADRAEEEFDRLMEDSRRSAVVQQAELVQAQQEAKRIADENLKLAAELSRRLKDPK